MSAPVPRSRRLPALALLTIAAALVVAVAGCGGDAEEPGDVIGDDGEPDATATPTPGDEGDGDDDDVSGGDGAETTTAYFARTDDSGIWVEPETHELDTPTVAVARAALELLIAGETRDPGLASMLPTETELVGVNIDGEVLVADFSSTLATRGGSSAEEGALAQQLAHTAAQFEGVEGVLVHIDGAEITELWGHLDWSEPVAPDPFALTPITIESPRWGETVATGALTAEGQANTFEATVLVRLIDPQGSTVEDTFTTATSGTGERGTWAHTFEHELDTPGTWAVEVEEPDPSGGEGRPPYVHRVEFTVE